MHSGADVDAFQAALNRDLGCTASSSQTSGANSGNIHSPSQSFALWQKAAGNDTTNLQRKLSLEGSQLKEQHQSELPLQQQNDPPRANEPSLQQIQPQHNRQQGYTWQNPSQNPQANVLQISEKKPLADEPVQVHNQDTQSQYAKLQKMSSQQASGTEQPSSSADHDSRVRFGVLVPTLTSQLDKDRAMQLNTLFAKLKKNELSIDGFTRHMKDIVGHQMLRLAVNKMQQGKTGIQATASQNQPRVAAMSSVTSVNKPELDTGGISVSKMASSSSTMPASVQGLNKHPQQHLQFQPSTYPIYARNTGIYRPYPGPSINASVSSVKTQPHDSQMRQITKNQRLGRTSFGESTQSANAMGVSKIERPNSTSEQTRLQDSSHSPFSNNSSLQISSAPRQGTLAKDQISGPSSSMAYVKQEAVDHGFEKQQRSHLPTPHGSISAQTQQGNGISGSLKDELEKQSARMGASTPNNVIHTSSASPSRATGLDPSSAPSTRFPWVSTAAGGNARTLPKKPSVGQKNSHDSLGSSSPPASKKQKVSGTSLDQSIEQLNDVTVVSGVNLKEEEEQLFSGPKEDSRVSEASRRVVQEEEERLILHKTLLPKKLAEINGKGHICLPDSLYLGFPTAVKFGLKHISNDVERCLSLFVEERMRGLLSNMIRLSKQRVDAKKSRHQTIITSDIRKQITEINQKVKDEWEKKQAEAEKLKKLSNPEDDLIVDGEKDKEENNSKSTKTNKEEDDKMRTIAANVAARAAVGGDDMLSKWELMAEQARRKREGGSDTASGSHIGKDVSKRTSSAQGRNLEARDETGRRGSGIGASRKFGRNPQLRVVQTLSIKDVIAALEREPKMSKSTLIYRLCNKISPEASSNKRS